MHLQLVILQKITIIIPRFIIISHLVIVVMKANYSILMWAISLERYVFLTLVLPD